MLALNRPVVDVAVLATSRCLPWAPTARHLRCCCCCCYCCCCYCYCCCCCCYFCRARKSLAFPPTKRLLLNLPSLISAFLSEHVLRWCLDTCCAVRGSDVVISFVLCARTEGGTGEGRKKRGGSLGSGCISAFQVWLVRLVFRFRLHNVRGRHFVHVFSFRIPILFGLLPCKIHYPPYYHFL